MKMFNTKITGTGKYHPKRVMSNDEISEMVDTTDEWIIQRTGIKERRISDPETEYPSAMATHAAKEAIKNAGIEPNDISMIIFSVTISDYVFPGTSTQLQTALGITNQCACLDINAACTGWVYGLQMADALIKTGVHKHILLVGTEMTSAFNNWQDRSTCVLFGDGSGVSVLSRSEDESGPKFIDTILGCDGSKAESLIRFKGGAKFPIDKEILEKREHYITMDGQVVFKNAVKTMSRHCATLLERNNISKEEVDWFIPHQANLRIIETTAKLLDFPMEKVIVNVEKYANTSSASIPAALHEAVMDGRIKRGQTLLFAAFGAGLTSGAVLLKY